MTLDGRGPSDVIRVPIQLPECLESVVMNITSLGIMDGVESAYVQGQSVSCIDPGVVSTVEYWLSARWASAMQPSA
ncbi:hypothetical protein SAMN02799638_02614 [Arthrobacter sp. UNCCL28]|jgi:hypothetical protein|nr:hypothetical protein SAMN02799638_02614 [Arthrobacter sp. UNCCL28]